MRVAFVCDSYLPVPNGTAVSVMTLKRGLEKMGHTVYVFAPQVRGWRDSDRYVIRLPAVFRLGQKQRPWVWPSAAVSKKDVERLKLDIIHSHFYFELFPFAWRLARSMDIPLVHTFYKIFPEFARHHPSRLASGQVACNRALRQTVEFCRRCDRIITLSGASKKYFSDLSISAPITALPVGVYPRDYASFPSETIKAKFKIPLKSRLLLFVGRIEDDNNLKFLFRSFRQVWRALDEVHLLVVGGGSRLSDICHAVAREPFGKSVTFTGALPKAQVNKIYGAADILVYTGRLDPQPLVIIESLTAGTPVVAVKGYGAQDFISENQDGLVASFSQDDFVGKVLQLLRRDKMRLDFSLKARLNSQRYKASNLTADLVDIYGETIEDYSSKLTK